MPTGDYFISPYYPYTFRNEVQSYFNLDICKLTIDNLNILTKEYVETKDRLFREESEKKTFKEYCSILIKILEQETISDVDLAMIKIIKGKL